MSQIEATKPQQTQPKGLGCTAPTNPFDDPEWYEFLAGQHKKTGKWHGMLYRNKPTPSGCMRWLLHVSDNRGWETADEAVKQLRLSLGANVKGDSVNC